MSLGAHRPRRHRAGVSSLRPLSLRPHMSLGAHRPRRHRAGVLKPSYTSSLRPHSSSRPLSLRPHMSLARRARRHRAGVLTYAHVCSRMLPMTACGRVCLGARAHVRSDDAGVECTLQKSADFCGGGEIASSKKSKNKNKKRRRCISG